MTILDPEHFAATLHHLRIVLDKDATFDARTKYVAAHRALFPIDVERVEGRGTGERFERHVLGMLSDHWKGKYSAARGPEIARLDADGNIIPKDTVAPYDREIIYKFM